MINNRSGQFCESAYDQDEEDALEAVRTLIRWAGENPDREEMKETPARVLAFYKEFFTGYGKTPDDYTGSIAPDITYDDFILVRDIKLVSFCAHHMLPSYGTADIAYIPDCRVAGLGTLARIAKDCAHRLTTQETITCDILKTITQVFVPQGVAVRVSLSHGCMMLRDPRQHDSVVLTTKFSGVFEEDDSKQKQFLMLTNKTEDFLSESVSV